MLKHIAIFHSRISAHDVDRLLFARFEILERFEIRPHVPPHRLRTLFDQLRCGINPALWKRNLQRNKIEQNRKSQFVHDGLFRFGEHREMHYSFLHGCDPVEKDANRAQAHVLGGIQTEFAQAHAQSKISDRAGAVIRTGLSFLATQMTDEAPGAGEK
jgi:hypothetical protein